MTIAGVGVEDEQAVAELFDSASRQLLRTASSRSALQDAPAASSALPLSDRVHAAFRLAEKEEEATRALVGESEGGMTSS